MWYHLAATVNKYALLANSHMKTMKITPSVAATPQMMLSIDRLPSSATICCTGRRCEIDLVSHLRPEVLLFHEAPSRILITTTNPKRVAQVAEKHEIECPIVGITIEKGIEIRQRNITLGSWEIATLRAAYESSLESHLK